MVGAVDTGDADRIVRLLSAELGRVSVVVRRARSRSGAATQVGTVVRVTAASPRDGLYAAKSVEVVAGPMRARDSLLRIGLLSYGCELCAALAPEHTPAPKLAGLLRAWLALLEGPNEPGTAHRLALEAKACTFAGLAPALLRCATCGGGLDDPTVFDPESGGGIHARCGGGARVTTTALRDLDQLRRQPLSEIGDAAAPQVPAWLLAGFVEHHLGRPLVSRAWLAGAG